MSIEQDLVARYGQDVLKVKRQPRIPPRVAKPKHRLVVEPTRKAQLVKELRRNGSKATICRHRETRETTTHLVMTNCLPAFTKHAKRVVTELPCAQILRLFGQRALKPASANPYTIGQSVMYGEIPGVVAGTNGDVCVIAVTMLGKQHLRPLHYDRLRPG
jgi:hypothetical protein